MVIVVLGVLLALGVSAGLKALRDAERKETLTIQQMILAAVEAYRDSDADGALPDAANMNGLYILLTDNAAAMDTLRNLPDGAIDRTNGTFCDSYGKEMRYQPDKGFGGTPQIESAGPDAKFPEDEDNIFSNEH